MKVVLISGKAQSGKDTFASAFAKACEAKGKRVLITHFADFLKFFCKQYLGWDGQKDENGRRLLQYVGTDVFRKNYQDCWVDIMAGLLRGCKSEYDIALIPDVRFPNEIESLQKANDAETAAKQFASDIYVIRVVRPGYENGLSEEAKAHPSETALDNYTFSCVYSNTKPTLEELEIDVADWADAIIGDRLPK